MLTKKHVLALDPNYSDFVILNISISYRNCTFLLDSQADISLIKRHVVRPRECFDVDNLIDITGITDNPITTLGSKEVILSNDDFEVEHVLQVVPDDFNIPSDGIIGKDFLKRFKCNLDYNSMLLTFCLGDKLVSIPVLEGPEGNTMVLPARSEVVRRFNLRNKIIGPQLVNNQELKEGIFVARTIIDSSRPSRPLVRILNATDYVKVIKNDRLEIEDLSDYDIFKMEKTLDSPERTKVLLKIIEQNVPNYAKEKLLPLCAEFADVFALETDRMTTNNFYSQKLRMKDNTPVYIKNYRTPHSHKSEIDAQVAALLKNNFIEPSTSEFNSPIILVPKPMLNGKTRWRMCLDYRQINKKLVADKFPLPRIDEILDSLGRAKCFSVLDLFQEFHQVPLDPESRDVTSFNTSSGSYRWKVLPFGLNVSPNSFSRMMSISFAGIPPDQAFLYLDDVIVIGHNEHTHLSNLRSVFQILRKRNLKIHPHKCKFFKCEVTFLGHLCTPNGIRPDPSKTVKVQNYPTPTSREEAHRFVSFANYYRRFIKNFSIIAKPLNNLTKKSSKFIWSEQCQNSFLELKEKLINPPILTYPDFTKPFIVTVDASTIGCGAVLSQMNGQNDLPIYFASKTWSKADAMKSTPVQECLAIHFALTHFRPYVYGVPFLVRTDHK